MITLPWYVVMLIAWGGMVVGFFVAGLCRASATEDRRFGIDE